MTAMRLMEEEQGVLELESQWEGMESFFCKFQQEQEAIWKRREAMFDKILRSLQDLRSTMETRDASSGSCKSQLELPKFSDILDFQKPIDVDQAIVDEDLMEQHSSGRYEEMDTELKIGVEDCTRVSKEIEDIEFLEVAVTPLQNTEEMEIFRPLPHNGKSTEVKKRRESEQNKLKGTERLSHARQNAPVSELIVVLPISACYSLSLSWLLNWFPRPRVKLKFMARCEEEMVDKNNMFGDFNLSRYISKMYDAAPAIGKFHCSDVVTADQQDFESKEGEGELKLVKKVILGEEKHCSIVEEKATRSVKEALTIYGNEFDSSKSLYQHLDVASFRESANLLG